MKLTEKEINDLKSLLIEWEDDNIFDYTYCNRVGEILGLENWTNKGAKK